MVAHDKQESSDEAETEILYRITIKFFLLLLLLFCFFNLTSLYVTKTYPCVHIKYIYEAERKRMTGH